MNLSLIVTTILASAADSVNPVAITQQFVLQGMVRKRQHIWFFIAATFLTNLACGMLAYCGLLEILVRLWTKRPTLWAAASPCWKGSRAYLCWRWRRSGCPD